MTYSFCKDFLHWLLVSVTPEREISVTEVIGRLFEKEGKTRSLSQVNHLSSSKPAGLDYMCAIFNQAYHRYSLNYINALTYLESLRKHQEFCDFEKVDFLLVKFKFVTYVRNWNVNIQWCYRDPRCKKLQLTDFLVSPVHHIMKVPLIIKHIEERTDNPEEKAVISKVLDMKEASLSKLLSCT